jgi:hypothetical protein
MKIEIKRNLIIFYDPYEWEAISAKIIEEHGPSMMISWKMKRELGVTVRRHKGLTPWDIDESSSKYTKGRFYYDDQIHLDFWSEAAMSFFMLKYLN